MNEHRLWRGVSKTLLLMGHISTEFKLFQKFIVKATSYLGTADNAFF